MLEFVFSDMKHQQATFQQHKELQFSNNKKNGIKMYH